MEEDVQAPGVTSSFWDPDTGPIPLSPSTTPPPVPTVTTPPSEVKLLFDMIVAKMVPMEREISRIASIVDGTTKPGAVGPKAATPPLHRGGPSNSMRGGTTPYTSVTPPAGSLPGYPLGSRSSGAPAPRIDDDDAAFLALGASQAGRGTVGAGQGLGTPRALAQGGSDPVPRRSAIGLDFAAIVTKEALGQRDKAAGHARLAREVQKRNPSRKFKPGHLAALEGFTDVVVIREGGSDNREVEEAFRRRLPVDIAQAAQHALNALVRAPPIILRGRWSETVDKTGNFIFRFAGNLSPHIIASYQESLCGHFPAAESACIVPITGWTWVQFRGVDVAHVDGDSEYIYNGEELLTALRANPCFNTTTFCVHPHWQGNPANFKGRTAMVIAAILDPDNSACQRASSEGVCMFGRHIKFVRAGNSLSLVQCSHCHEIGHYYSSPKCRGKTSRCYRCGGAHDAQDHDFECTKSHKVVGVCDCVPKCILCKNSGHHARKKACPARGDFVLPCLPRAAPVEATPAIEDALKSDVIPFTQPKARPAHRSRDQGGKGKSSRAPRIPKEAHLVEDICAHNDEMLHIYCFCCPAMEVDDYRLLYTNPLDLDRLPTLSVRGKSAQDIFGECILRKNKGTSSSKRQALTSFTLRRNSMLSSSRQRAKRSHTLIIAHPIPLAQWIGSWACPWTRRRAGKRAP
jgi:hypothetical protein